MAIDSYAPCPGGTGKKIKFCCAELVGDLEQLDRLIEGDQISAALEQVKRLSEKHPGRACLMATRTKLELGSKKFAEAATSSRAFLDAFPENPLALGQAAVTEALADRMQEAARLFDTARDLASRSEAGMSPELVRIGATLVQAAAQLGDVGFAQGLVEWMIDRSLGTQEEQRLLAAIVGSSGVPPALRTKVRLQGSPAHVAWQPAFEAALDHARHWRLLQALASFRELKPAAGEGRPESRPLLTNIAVLCEMVARPVEASEAWLAVARLPDVPPDDAIEATGRAIALETEAKPDRSPQIRFASLTGPLRVAAGEEGVTAIELLEDKLRHDGHCEPATFDRTTWVSRGAVPPRSVWRVYAAAGSGGPARLLASLLIFGRQTDREPEAVLQGFGPDVAAARPLVEPLLGTTLTAADAGAEMPGTSPTAWLLGSQFRMTPPPPPTAPLAADAPSIFDAVMQEQRDALWGRFLEVWPDTELPELLGRTPRAVARDPEGGRRVEALVREGESMSRRRDACDAWAAMRTKLGLPLPPEVVSDRPLEEVPPLRWHRLDFKRLSLEELRGVFATALDAGFERAAERAAEAIAARPDAAPEDRWEALGVLEDRADSSVRKLEILAELRGIGRALKANDGMLDVAELRIRLQRGDQNDVVRLLDHLRREHSRDQQVLQALAEVLMEAGIDIGGLAGRGGSAPGMAAAGGLAAGASGLPSGGAAAQADAGKLWTPGGESAGPPGEKKVIWTPGS
jgi:hypothetical protein